MSDLQAIVLGILQGLGEFLPISSSGHLIVVPWLLGEFLPISSSGHLIVVPWFLGWPEHGLAFDVALHVGTLAAVFFAFARDWWQLIRAGLRGIGSGRPFDDPESRLLWLLALGTIPGVIAGLLLEKWADTVFRSPGLVATNMAVMGAVLLLADREANGRGDLQRLSVRDIALIGLAQACAILPGVSRSGATISMGLFLGYRREEAARISFLLAMPITLGAALYKVPKLFSEGNDIVAIVAGIVAAAVFGFLSIRLLLAYVKTKNYLPFAYYRFAFAAVVWATLLFRAGR